MEKRRYKIKPPEVWTQVRQDYLSGLDAKTTAARHGVTEAALRARATKEGWSRHPRTETPPPAPNPLSLQDGADLSPDDPNDPSALARAAAQASGRALHAQDFAQARALAALAETYRKLADRDGPGRASRLTIKTAPPATGLRHPDQLRRGREPLRHEHQRQERLGAARPILAGEAEA